LLKFGTTVNQALNTFDRLRTDPYRCHYLKHGGITVRLFAFRHPPRHAKVGANNTCHGDVIHRD